MENENTTAIVHRVNRGLDLTTREDRQWFAEGLVKSGLAPKSFKYSSQVIVAMQAGGELGMLPMQSLNSLYVIEGSPALYAEAALALVMNSGLLEDFEEKIEGDGEKMAAVCRSKRRGLKTPVITEFSVEDAKKARLWGKSGTWQTHPKRMLKYRARAFNLRDNFPDVLKGMHIVEELLYEEPVHGYNVTILKRADRKQVENTAPVEGEGTESPGAPVSEADVRVRIAALMEQFVQLLGFKVETEKMLDHFLNYCAFILGGSKEDYRDPEIFNQENIEALERGLAEGIPEPVMATIPKPVAANKIPTKPVVDTEPAVGEPQTKKTTAKKKTTKPKPTTTPPPALTEAEVEAHLDDVLPEEPVEAGYHCLKCSADFTTPVESKHYPNGLCPECLSDNIGRKGE